MIVVRTKFKNSKPCSHCVKLLKNIGIKSIIYTTGNDQNLLHKETVKNMNIVNHGLSPGQLWMNTI